MDKVLYKALLSYYNALEKMGQISIKQARKVLTLLFYRDLLYNDINGYLNKDDYHLIEKALDCLFGSTCLLPYEKYSMLFTRRCSKVDHSIPAISDNPAIQWFDIDSRLQNLENMAVLKLSAFDISPEIPSDVTIITEDIL